ncbi:GGDEF domain-containing protein [Parahaliea sp. F7430]|uniref:diguanylate cyclase n=2 Tax=Sediminihaliea albiluteola TaxID=2758564 RepID=A0A7W2TTP6_9GAMM|nr:GGDEF domain-containing protein [Sediminihaliea albiluteola]
MTIKLGAALLVFANLAMVLYSVVVLFLLRRTDNLTRLSLAYLFPFFSVMILAFQLPETSITIFGWVFLVPILSHLLLGRLRGLILSLFFMGLTAIVFWLKYHQTPELMQMRSIANMVVLSFCILACSHAYEISRERSELQLLQSAHRDYLTGLTNRMGLNEFFLRESKRAHRENWPLSYLAVDLDYFKQVNDQYGHGVGDETLTHVAKVMKDRLRATDLLARIGGEEFGIFLIKTSANEAHQVAHSLCHAVISKPLKLKDIEVKVSVSIGVAELGPDGDSLQSLMSAADRRLYHAKDHGRNQVVGATSLGAKTSESLDELQTGART